MFGLVFALYLVNPLFWEFWAGKTRGHSGGRDSVALRFQKASDDAVVRAAKEERHLPPLIFLLLLLGAIDGAISWLSGESLASYLKRFAVFCAIALLFELVSPIYYEFRIRAKEIDGKVSEIEKAVIASKENHAELLERLAMIEEKLDSMETQGRIS
jgi:hypothetical protein